MLGVFSFTEPGHGHENQDLVLAEQHPACADCWLLLLADGQGGRAGGGEAARLACQAALATASTLTADQLLNPLCWPAMMRRADDAVAADTVAGYTTLVGLCVHEDGVVAGASSGDSAAMAVSGGRTTALTARQVKNPPVGSGSAIFVPFGLRLQAPWRVLAMSDGVWKYVGWDRVAAAASAEGGEALIQSLRNMARLRTAGKFQDDFTIALVQSDV